MKQLKEEQGCRVKIKNLRVCASCEWIFRYDIEKSFDCPKCNFGSYSATYVYGKYAYNMEKTQKRYIENKIFNYKYDLIRSITDNNLKVKEYLRVNKKIGNKGKFSSFMG